MWVAFALNPVFCNHKQQWTGFIAIDFDLCARDGISHRFSYGQRMKRQRMESKHSFQEEFVQLFGFVDGHKWDKRVTRRADILTAIHQKK